MTIAVIDTVTGEITQREYTAEELADIAISKAAEDAYNDPDATAERDITSSFETDKLRRLIFQIEYDQESRLRVLEGRPAITRAQYRNALLAAYKAI